MENKKKSRAYKILILLAILIPVILGFSYAYFLAQTKGNKTNISGNITNKFEFNLQTDNDGYISASDLIPISSNEIDTLSEVGQFNIVAGNNANKITYKISLENISISNNLKSSDFKWILECTNDSSKSTSGDFSSINGTTKDLISNLTINANSTDYYKLKLYIEETNINQSNLLNGSFSAKVSATAELTYQS